MRKTREETLRSRLADLAAQIEQLDKARAETKAMLDVLVGLPPEQRQALEGFLETVNPISQVANPQSGGILSEALADAYRRRHTVPVDDHYPLGK